MSTPPNTVFSALSLHDALPIWRNPPGRYDAYVVTCSSLRSGGRRGPDAAVREDRKSTRLNSSHVATSYAVFCLEKITFPSDSSSVRLAFLINCELLLTSGLPRT